MSPTKALEALLLMATDPLPTDELAAALDAPTADIDTELRAIAEFYETHDRGIRLVFVAGGWRLATADDVADVIEAWIASDQRARLSQAALETLAVIAYLQPVSRGRVAAVRGVNVDGVVRTLTVRGLIREAGHDATTGAVTFETTGLFLEKLGLADLGQLPDLAPLLPDAIALEAELGELAKEEDHD